MDTILVYKDVVVYVTEVLDGIAFFRLWNKNDGLCRRENAYYIPVFQAISRSFTEEKSLEYQWSSQT